jgi:hypothetical protein
MNRAVLTPAQTECKEIDTPPPVVMYGIQKHGRWRYLHELQDIWYYCTADGGLSFNDL